MFISMVVNKLGAYIERKDRITTNCNYSAQNRSENILFNTFRPYLIQHSLNTSQVFK